MAGGANKKRKSVIDFKTVKRKLGKAYKSPTHTDLSFKTRSIFIPTQSINEEKNDIVNSRNLTLADLLTQSRHYNESTRKEAVSGLKELLLENPILIERHLSTISSKIVELMLDSSAEVRTGLYDLLDNVLPLASESIISPFFPLLMAYITTGLTHINAAVRLDALQYTNLLMHYYPSLVAQNHHKLLPHLINLLNSRDPPPKTAEETRIRRLQKKEKKKVTDAHLHIPNALKMKTVLLDSLFDLLSAVLIDNIDKDSEEPQKMDIEAPYTKHPHLGNLHNDVVQLQWLPSNPFAPIYVPFQSTYSMESIMEENEQLDMQGSQKIETTFAQRSDGFNSFDESSMHLHDPEKFRNFFVLVMKLLIEQWLECSPDNLTNYALHPLESIFKLAVLLLEQLSSLIGSDSESQAAKEEFLQPFLKEVKTRIMPSFPFVPPPSWKPEDIGQIDHINILIVSMCSLFLTENNATEDWVGDVIDFTLKAFSGEHSNSINGSFAKELMPIIQRLCTTLNDERRIKLLKAFLRFNDEIPANSPSKKLCLEFLAYLILYNNENDCLPGTFANSKQFATEDEVLEISETKHQPSIPSDLFQSLLISLPKTLWKLQNQSPELSTYALGILSNYGAVCRRTQSDITRFDNLQSALTPFFWTSITKKPRIKKGTKKGSEELEEEAGESQESMREVFGPFVKLPSSTQLAALCVVSNYREISIQMSTALAHCLSSPRLRLDVFQFALENITFANNFVEIQDYVSFLLSILVGLANNKENTPFKQAFWRNIVKSSLLLARAAAQLQLKEFLSIIEDHVLSVLEAYNEGNGTTELALSVCSFLAFYSGLTSISTCYPDDSSTPLPKSILDILPSIMKNLMTDCCTSKPPYWEPFKAIFLSIPSIFSPTVECFLKETGTNQEINCNQIMIISSMITQFKPTNLRSILNSNIAAIEKWATLLQQLTSEATQLKQLIDFINFARLMDVTSTVLTP